MAKYWRHTLLIFSLLNLLSCAYSVHQVHVSDFVAPVGSYPKIIESKAEQHVISGLVFDTNYADQAYRHLARKCVNGIVHGITSRHSTDLGFFNWTNRLHLRGICSKKMRKK